MNIRAFITYPIFSLSDIQKLNNFLFEQRFSGNRNVIGDTEKYKFNIHKKKILQISIGIE